VSPRPRGWRWLTGSAWGHRSGVPKRQTSCRNGLPKQLPARWKRARCFSGSRPTRMATEPCRGRPEASSGVRERNAVVDVMSARVISGPGEHRRRILHLAVATSSRAGAERGNEAGHSRCETSSTVELEVDQVNADCDDGARGRRVRRTGRRRGGLRAGASTTTFVEPSGKGGPSDRPVPPGAGVRASMAMSVDPCGGRRRDGEQAESTRRRRPPGCVGACI